MATESIEALAAFYLETLGRARRRAPEGDQQFLEFLWLRILADLAAYERGDLDEGALRATLERAPLIDALVASFGDGTADTDWDDLVQGDV